MTNIPAARTGKEAVRPTASARALPVVYASLYAPAGNRSRHLVITSPCPYCAGRHHHFTAEAASFNRKRAGCRGGRYLIRIARTYQRPGRTGAVISAAA